MAKLTCKVAVRFKRFTRANLRILTALLVVAEKTTSVGSIVITSANDGKHSRQPLSQHYKDAAVDVRVRNFPRIEARNRFASALTAELGQRFYVLLHGKGQNLHIHVQQRKGTTYAGPLS